MKQKAIICDIDGCLLDTSRIYNEAEEKNIVGAAFFNFFDRRANDPKYSVKNSAMFDLVNFFKKEGYAIIILTARTIKIQSETYQYLTEGYKALPKDIIMVSRLISDYGLPDYMVKENKLEALRKDYDIRLAIDDNLYNLEMFRRNNIETVGVH
jgi:predicted secreted acid phosphatase